jgi:hypothetical protein
MFNQQIHKVFINIYLLLPTLLPTYHMLKVQTNWMSLLHVGVTIKRLKPHKIQQADTHLSLLFMLIVNVTTLNTVPSRPLRTTLVTMDWTITRYNAKDVCIQSNHIPN